jgi:hypothetical protein
MTKDPYLLTEKNTGDKYRITGPWYPTKFNHGDKWNYAGDLLSCNGKRYKLHKLGSLNRFRAIDDRDPITHYFCELTYVYTPT